MGKYFSDVVEQAIADIYYCYDNTRAKAAEAALALAVEQGDAHGITVAGGIDRADLRAYWARIPPPAIAILGRSKNTLQGIHSHPASAGFQLAAAEPRKGFGRC